MHACIDVWLYAGIKYHQVYIHTYIPRYLHAYCQTASSRYRKIILTLWKQAIHLEPRARLGIQTFDHKPLLNHSPECEALNPAPKP